MNTRELLQARLVELRAEKETILSKTVDLKAEREKFNAIASEANARALELTAKIHAVERPAGQRGMIQVLEEISAVAQALGGKRMNG